MKNFLIFLIRLYQFFVSPLLHAIFGPKLCRYNESCSDYSIRVIKEKGMIKGTVLSARRLLSFQPFGRIHK